MKRCPTCNANYADITLRFCLQDGTPLVDAPQIETPTVVLNETETVVARGGHGGVQIPTGVTGSAAWQQSQVTHVASLQPEKRRSNTAIAVALTVVAMSVVFGVLGIGAWLFFGNSSGEIAKNTVNKSTNSNVNIGITPSPSITPQISPTATATKTPIATPSANSYIPSTPPPSDDSAVRSQVSDRLYNWKSMAESHNLNSYMSNYDDTVNYYGRGNVSSGTVRADKARAFSLYNSMRISLSDMNVSIGPSGETATATFDKEWSFSGRDTSSGKVRAQFQFRRVNGQWLITAEKDLKVYYTR